MATSLSLLGEYDTDSDVESDSEIEKHSNKFITTKDLIKTEENKSHTITHQENIDLDKEVNEESGRSFFDANYSDNDSSSETSDKEDIPPVKPLMRPRVIGEIKKLPSELSSDNLPLPQLSKIHSGIVEATPGSVFSNPYREAEDAKLAILKHHVALAPSEEKKEEKNDVKFKRGRKRKQGEGPQADFFDEYDSGIKRDKLNRVKAGVPQGLLPSQKYMKSYQQHQAKERPWTMRH